MIKKLFLFFVFLFLCTFISSCKKEDKLLLLNWGEYINEDLVLEFERLYNCSVLVSVCESNELFYAKIKSGTTAYDLVVPSDYMVEKMHDEDLLSEIDYDLLPSFSKERLLPQVNGIITQLEKTFPGARLYMVPYLFGTFGLMYNKEKEGLEDAINSFGWEAYFNPSLLPSQTKCGMYNVPRFAYATTRFLKKENPNIVNKTLLDDSYNTLKNGGFTQWGTDQLKKQIASQNLDIAYMYTGDFLDQLYIELQSGTKLEDITFDIYIPNETIAFLDSLVIPKKSRHKELAHKFINFIIEKENAYLNSSVVGYCTPYVDSYNMIVDYENVDKKWVEYFNEEDYGAYWLRNWSYAMKTYYPNNDDYKGIVLSNKHLSRDDLTDITNMVNNVKTR